MIIKTKQITQQMITNKIDIFKMRKWKMKASLRQSLPGTFCILMGASKSTFIAHSENTIFGHYFFNTVIKCDDFILS